LGVLAPAQCVTFAGEMDEMTKPELNPTQWPIGWRKPIRLWQRGGVGLKIVLGGAAAGIALVATYLVGAIVHWTTGLTFDAGGFLGAIVGVMGAVAIATAEIRRERQARKDEIHGAAHHLSATADLLHLAVLRCQRAVFVNTAVWILNSRYETIGDERIYMRPDAQAAVHRKFISQYLKLGEPVFPPRYIDTIPAIYGRNIIQARVWIEPRLPDLVNTIRDDGGVFCTSTEQALDLFNTAKLIPTNCIHILHSASACLNQQIPEYILQRKPDPFVAELHNALSANPQSAPEIWAALQPFFEDKNWVDNTAIESDFGP